MTNSSQTRTGGRPATQATIAGEFGLSVGIPDRTPPSGWSWTKLTDVARLETGHTPSRKRPEYWGGDVPWIGIRDATANHGRTLQDTQQHTNQLGLDNSSARLLPRDTVCLSRTASVGYVVVMGRPMATSQDFVNWVCSPELDHRYLKYVLLAERRSFLRFASGTTHQTIYFPEVKAFHVCLPPLTEQRAIAHILGTLDDKIELNRRIDETLEAMARALFKSWFVDFDPVRAKMDGRWHEGDSLPGLPAELYDLFPDRLVESELGEVPEGWEVGSLGDVATLNPASWSKKNAPDRVHYVDLGNTNWGYIDALTDYLWDDAPSRARRILEPWDTIVGTVRPGNGAYALVMSEGLTGSTAFAVLRPSAPRFRSFVYFAATSSESIRHLSHLASGGAYPAVRPAVVAALECVMPPSAVLKQFASNADPLCEKIGRNRIESHVLASLRDTLLPRLISGELRVSDAERIVELTPDA